jgi:uncharacterized protein
MKTAFIFHGTDSNPKANWFPWLKSKLEDIGYQVYVPQFPQSGKKGDNWDELSAWLISFKQYKYLINHETIIIAHSKGAVFCYHLLPSLKKRLHAVFLVAPWYEYYWYREGSKISTFHVEPFHWEYLKNTSDYFEVFQSSNDTISVWEGEKIAKDVGGDILVVKNAGHFNTEYDKKFTTFPILLEEIKKVDDMIK